MVRTYLRFHNRNIRTFFLLGVFLWSLAAVKWNADLFHKGGREALRQIGLGLVHPDFSPYILRIAVVAAWKTVAYAVAGMSLAMLIALVFGVLASGVTASGPAARSAQMAAFRGLLGFMRAIHELVWGLLFVASIGLSPFAGIFAIAIPYGGILGRIFADMLRDVPAEPVTALRTAGASRLQTLIYGYFPIALADMLSYLMYRFECAIRSSAIMSFIGLGGLGFQIQLSLNDLKYDQVWTFLLFLVAIVLAVDLWSRMLRKRLVAG